MMDIRKDVPGLWCDDITFCPEQCGWKSCPRNHENIRDRTIPHSFCTEIPGDCPKRVERRGSWTPDNDRLIKSWEIFRESIIRMKSVMVRSFEQYVNSELEYCIGQIIEDTIAELKEQEARVMTLDEVKAFDWDYCYLEEERLPGKEYRIICGDYALTCITWPCIASMRIQHGDDSYGKKWRCWSAKPTDEQRQEVKWDG